jgi:hypothetical protein
VGIPDAEKAAAAEALATAGGPVAARYAAEIAKWGAEESAEGDDVAVEE